MAELAVFALVSLVIYCLFLEWDSAGKSLRSSSDMLKSVIDNIRNAYTESNRKTSKATSIPYDQFKYRLAYVYLYFASHVNMITKTLSNFWPQVQVNIRQKWVKKIENRKLLRVCCIGGGPGSDHFGLLSFLKNENIFSPSVSIQTTVLDKFTEWKDMAGALGAALSLNESFVKSADISYVSFDFFQLTNDVTTSISRADIVTMVKFISAVSADRDTCSQQLLKILKIMKPGALILFVENSGENFDDLFEDEANKVGVTCLAKLNKKCCSLSKTEKEKAVKLRAIFSIEEAKHRPQTSSIITASLWRKPSA